MAKIMIRAVWQTFKVGCQFKTSCTTSTWNLSLLNSCNHKLVYSIVPNLSFKRFQLKKRWRGSTQSLRGQFEASTGHLTDYKCMQDLRELHYQVLLDKIKYTWAGSLKRTWYIVRARSASDGEPVWQLLHASLKQSYEMSGGVFTSMINVYFITLVSVNYCIAVYYHKHMNSVWVYGWV